MKEISDRTSMITVSMGSGKKTDVIYLFMEDICGDNLIPPRHAKAYGNLLKLKQQVNLERLKVLKAFKKDALSGKFPQKKQSVSISNQEFKKFLNLLNS